MAKGLRPGLIGRLVLTAGLVVLLGLALAGCSDEPAAEDNQGVAGKTPVVGPEDVFGKRPGATTALAPDYRQAMTAALENVPSGPAAGKPGAPTLSDPDAGRLFAENPGPAVPPPGAMPVVGPGPMPAPKPGSSPGLAPAQAPGLAPGPTAGSPASASAEMPAKGASPQTVGASGAPSTAGFPAADCRQLVLVTAADVRADKGILRRLTRSAPGAPWTEVGQPVPCRLGRGGLGAGQGLVGIAAGAAKRQGDGRTPAGLFPLPAAFGAAPAQAAGARLPYTAVTDRVACVTDPASPLFGRVVGPDERPEGGLRQDRMARDDGANAWGVVIGHNVGAVDPQGGTCLFVNVRPAGGPPTGGSIGIPAEAAAALVAWLDPAARPLLAVLPESDLHALRSSWGLP
ncbi:MAG: hypothetical protein ACLGQH_03765 [Acidobacteriota bacterium]